MISFSSVDVLREIVNAEHVETFLLLYQDFAQVKLEQLADGGEIEKALTQLDLQHLPAVLAERAGEMGFHVVLEFVKTTRLVGQCLLASVHLEAPATGYRLDDSAVNPGIGLLRLGEYIENASVADEVFRNRLLETRTKHPVGFFHRTVPPDPLS